MLHLKEKEQKARMRVVGIRLNRSVAFNTTIFDQWESDDVATKKPEDPRFEYTGEGRNAPGDAEEFKAIFTFTWGFYIVFVSEGVEISNE